MADGFKPTTTRQHNSGGAQKDKTGVAFFIPAEVKEKKSTGIAKSPQSEAVACAHKKDDGIMPQTRLATSTVFLAAPTNTGTVTVTS